MSDDLIRLHERSLISVHTTVESPLKLRLHTKYVCDTLFKSNKNNKIICIG